MPDLSALGIKISSTGVVKTTKELTEFSKAATAARNAAKNPIAIKVTGSAAKALSEIRSIQTALNSVRASTRAGLAIRISTGGSAAAIRDIARMGTSIREARAAARSPINVRVQATGVNETIAQLQRLIVQIERARRETGRGAGGGGGGGPSGSDVSAVNSMKSAVLGLVSAYALLRGAQTYAALTDQAKLLTAQLKLATNETGSFSQAQQDVRRIAAETRSELDSTATLYGKLMLNSRQLGITQLEAARATETVTKAFKISGSTTVEAAQGTRQLVQALQSGVLRGDEFNTMAEAAPRLQKLLADSLGVTQGELRKLAEDGQLTSDKLTRAFTDQKFTKALDDEFAQLPVTFDDAMTQIRNAAVITFGAFDNGGEFSKAIVNFMIGGTDGMAKIEDAARDLGITVRSEIDGMVAGTKIFVNALQEAATTGAAVVAAIVPGFRDLKFILDGIGSSGWGESLIGYLKTAYNIANPLAGVMAAIRGAGSGARLDSQRSRTGGMLAEEVANRAREAAIKLRDRDTQTTRANTVETKKNTGAKRERAKALTEEERAIKNAQKAAESYLDKLKEENAQYGKTEKQIRAMELAKHKQAAATDAVREALQKEFDQREYNLGIKELSEKQKLIDAQRTELDVINKTTEAQREAGDARIAALKGLSGDALEDELARISNEYEVQVIWLRAQAEAALDAANATHILAKAQAEIAQVRQGQGQDRVEHNFERDRQLALNTANEIANIIGGSVGDLIGTLAEALDRFAPELSAKLGNMLGSGFGEAMGAFSLAVEANKAIGKIFGFKGGPLGIFTGLLTKTPKASATINAIAGEFMDTIIKGTKKGLKEAAGNMANSIISSINDIATQLGLELTGNASVSVGVRKGQYRVDPTGQGRTKGAGVIDFGEDQAAAIAYAMLDAIKDGVLNVTGSVKTLLTLTDDLSTNVAKVQQFNSVFDELLQMTDPQAFENQALDKWRSGMDKLFAEAGATAEELAKLEELTGLKRAEIVEKYAQEVLQKEQARRELEIQIMTLEGKSAEALAATRALELEQMDEADKALQRRIYQLEDEAALAEKAAVIADERAALEQQLWALQGNTVALLEQERNAIDPLNRDLYDLIKAMEAWQASVQKSKDLFAAQSGIEQEILGLRAELTTGDEKAALQALALKLAREAELRAADATLVPLLELKYALEDQVKAATDLAAAEQVLIDARKAQEDEIKGLNRQWLELIGDTKTLREMDLAALLSDEARELQKQIWAYQDAQEAATKAAEEAAKAEEARAQAISDARDVLTQAYERESGALQEAIDKFKGFAESIAEFRKSLYTSNNPLASYAQIRGQFQNTARMASMGDEKSLGAFATDAQAYLDAALQNAGSRLEYDRIVAQVAQAAMRAEGGALGVASEAQQQVDLLKELVGGTIDVSDQVVSVVDALAALQALERDTTTPAMVTAIADLSNIIASGNTDANDADAESKVRETAIYDQLVALNARFRSWDDGGRQRVVVEDIVDVVITGQPIAVDQI